MTPARFGVAAWLALIVLQVVWYGWLAPPANGNSGLALALTLPPLLLPLFALRKGLNRALLWIGIISLGYFCHGIVASWAEPSVRWLAIVEVVVCLVLIGALASIVRSAKKRKAQHAG
jgi:uncharacterized membrane protein